MEWGVGFIGCGCEAGKPGCAAGWLFGGWLSPGIADAG
jgi:hypothetical protein